MKYKIALGVVNFTLTDRDLNQIINKLDDTKEKEWTIPVIQQITTDVTGYKGYLTTEARDMSDITGILKEIQKEIDKKKNKS